jgi:hypothetical protein
MQASSTVSKHIESGTRREACRAITALHEINDREVERPVVRIRVNWLGQGV